MQDGVSGVAATGAHLLDRETVLDPVGAAPGDA